MPILVRPVREQLEHDRIIRLLQARYKKKHDPVTNVGGVPPTSIVIGTAEFMPDLILVSNDKARKLEGVVEVETGESVNSLETLAQWGPFSRLRVPFHLYVPPHTLDTVRRLCREHNVTVAELWTYHTNLDQVRFTLIQKATDAAMAAARKAGLAGTPRLTRGPAAAAAAASTPTAAAPAAAYRRGQAAGADGRAEGGARKVRGGSQGIAGQGGQRGAAGRTVTAPSAAVKKAPARSETATTPAKPAAAKPGAAKTAAKPAATAAPAADKPAAPASAKTPPAPAKNTPPAAKGTSAAKATAPAKPVVAAKPGVATAQAGGASQAGRRAQASGRVEAGCQGPPSRQSLLRPRRRLLPPRRRRSRPPSRRPPAARVRPPRQQSRAAAPPLQPKPAPAKNGKRR